MSIDFTASKIEERDGARSDWYERRDELEPGMVFRIASVGGTPASVKLDRRVPGDGTKWYVADWLNDHWSYEDNTIEPGELQGEPI